MAQDKLLATRTLHRLCIVPRVPHHLLRDVNLGDILFRLEHIEVALRDPLAQPSLHVQRIASQLGLDGCEREPKLWGSSMKLHIADIGRELRTKVASA